MLQAELERVSSHRLLPPLDTTRYQLPAPTKPESEEEWAAALQNARAQLEHQRLRCARDPVPFRLSNPGVWGTRTERALRAGTRTWRSCSSTGRTRGGYTTT